MNRKEVEKKIEETINKVEAPDFEEVWQRIEPEIEKSHKRRFSWKNGCLWQLRHVRSSFVR